MTEVTDENGCVTYGLEVQQKSGDWLTASTGRTREYADDMFEQYVANGECCRIVDSEDETISQHIPAAPVRQSIDLSRTMFFVTAWPDQKWPVEVMWFIEQATKGLSVHPDYRNNVVVRDRTCARNTAIQRALSSPADFGWFIFIDNDVRPGMRSMRFLDLGADVNSCEVPMRTATAWSWPDAFHDPMWSISRAVLEAIDPPWFMQPYNQDSTRMEGCICKSFQKKVLAAGFTIAHGGWAEHDQDASWC